MNDKLFDNILATTRGILKATNHCDADDLLEVLNKQDLCMQNRNKHRVAARALFYVTARSLYNETLPVCGELLCRDHSTALHALNVFTNTSMQYTGLVQYAFVKTLLEQGASFVIEREPPAELCELRSELSSLQQINPYAATCIPKEDLMAYRKEREYISRKIRVSISSKSKKGNRDQDTTHSFSLGHIRILFDRVKTR